MKMCDGYPIKYMQDEIEKLREENRMLREQRAQVWDQASRAVQIERKLVDLLMTVQEARELNGS
jgi:hypothetical protein